MRTVKELNAEYSYISLSSMLNHVLLIEMHFLNINVTKSDNYATTVILSVKATLNTRTGAQYMDLILTKPAFLSFSLISLLNLYAFHTSVKVASPLG